MAKKTRVSEYVCLYRDDQFFMFVDDDDPVVMVDSPASAFKVDAGAVARLGITTPEKLVREHFLPFIDGAVIKPVTVTFEWEDDRG